MHEIICFKSIENLDFDLFFLIFIPTELNKSSSDVAAEGAILNEMLEIVAKRAALRPFDTSSSIQPQSRSSVAVDSKTVQSDVSLINNSQSQGIICRFLLNCDNWISLFCHFLIIYACIIYVAFWLAERYE